MRRRDWLSTALASYAGAEAWAQTATAKEAFRPYLQVEPVPGEGNVVRVYFSPSCSFSKSYFGFFKNLAATLPAGRRFAFAPLVNKADGVGYALAFAALEQHFPSYVNNFVEASLVGVLERGLGPSSWAAIDRFGKAARLPLALPAFVREHAAQARESVTAAVERQKSLGITNTPAVAVAGTYVVTPEFTNGDPALFSQLVNGLISMA